MYFSRPSHSSQPRRQRHGPGSRSFRRLTLGVGGLLALFLAALVVLTTTSHTPAVVTQPAHEPGDFNKDNIFVTLDGVRGERLVLLHAYQENPLRPMAMTGRILRLPCLGQRYVFRSVMEASASRHTIEYAAFGAITAVNLSLRLRCAQPLPSDVASHIALSLTSVRTTTIKAEPLVEIIGHRRAGGAFVGKVSVTDEPCPGKYVLRAALRSPAHFTELSYDVLINRMLANGKRDGNCLTP